MRGKVEKEPLVRTSTVHAIDAETGNVAPRAGESLGVVTGPFLEALVALVDPTRPSASDRARREQAVGLVHSAGWARSHEGADSRPRFPSRGESLAGVNPPVDAGAGEALRKPSAGVSGCVRTCAFL